MARISTVRLVLAIACFFDLELHQLDVDTAFLHADVEEEIYMSQPEGYEETGPNGEKMVCKLLKSIYGLKQAPRNWNKDVDKFLRKIGFVPSSVDPCLYIKVESNGDITIIVLYVDDLVVATSSMRLVNQFKEAIKGHYKMKDLGELRWVLGMEVRRDRKARTLEIIQTAYIDQLLARFGMKDCNPASTPISVKSLPRLTDKPSSEYRSLVGGLLYAAMVTRPDINFAVQLLGRHLQGSNKTHWQAGMQVLAYLKGTRNLGIMYGRSPDKDRMIMTGYSDADWGGDEATARSTTGYIFSVCGGPINWSSKLQPTVAKSTAESEYMAASAAAQEAIYMRQLLEDLTFKQDGATVIYEDNTGAIALTENPVHHQRTKHINIRYHFIRERVESGEIKLIHVPSAEQLADILTKPLAKPQIMRLRGRVLGYNTG